VECLKYLVHICSELGRRDDAQGYMEKLKKAERAQVGARRCLLCNFLSGGYTEPHGEAARTRAHSGGCECQLLSAVQCYAAQDMMHIEGRRLSRQMTTTVCSAVRIYYLHYIIYDVLLTLCTNSLLALCAFILQEDHGADLGKIGAERYTL